MNSSAPNNLAFSTITKKAPLASQSQNMAQSQAVGKFKDLIFSRDKEFTTIADPQARFIVNTDNLRQSLVIGPQTNLDFSLWKKSKKTGKTLQRNAKLAQSDISHILQDKNRKQYTTPSQLTPETYAEYQQRMTSSTSAQKKLILPWAPKTAGKAEFRIAFVRRPVAGTESKLDSAFYFDTKEDFERAKNYLKFIELLETRKTGTPPNALLNNLNQAFKGQLAVKFRKLMAIRANQARLEKLIQKETLVKNTNFLLTANMNLTNSLTNRWVRFARDRDFLKREQDRAVKDRLENLSNTIKRSSLILTLNSYLVGAMLEAWKNEAEARIQSYKEDIALYLDFIEIPATIIQPSLKVEVTVSKDYPESLVINNTRIRDKALERTLDFRLNCKIKGPKHVARTDAKGAVKPAVYLWNIAPSEILPGDRSSQYGNVQEELFALRFNEFILDHLDLIEVNFLLSDESETVIAQQYASLKSLYTASKKGNSVWIGMNTSYKGNLKSPLLHIKSFSNRIDHSNENVFDVETAGTSNLETITDTFYNFRFDMPTITPKQDKILELLPPSWNIIDEKTKSLKRNGQFGPFINTVKAKLAKHYYESTSRQLARLGKSAQNWAILQEKLTSYKPNKDRSQLYVDEHYIKNLAGLQKPVIEAGNGVDDGASQEFQEEYNGIVSYLFKRDKWESKEEWYRFYKELDLLCRKGLPPKHRLNIWSEMSRVVYFVNLTENEHKKQRGVDYYQQAYLNQDMNDRSRTVDNIYKKSKLVYEQLKKDAEKEFIYLYQELEDDLDFLREQYESSDKQKIPYERNLRSICRTFIFWSKLFGDSSREEKIRYFTIYSRAILILCHGLITCQTCSYMEQEVVVEEEQVFWNLISLATYIVSSYFETNEDSVSVDTLTFKEGENLERKKNKISNSALRCNQIKGIKGDLLILKILLKEYEPEIYSKFEELGLPLEFYFADHMLTLFFNLFNPGLTFRIWDVLFFEGSSANQVRCNRMIVCFLFVLLRECKAMLLKAKKATDINFIVQTYAKFQTKYGDFIKKAYQVSANYFEQALPRDQTMLQKLEYIKFALFASDYNKLDKKIRGIERSIEENYFTYTLQQNMALFALTNNKYQYRPDAKDETLSYTVLSRMIKDFQSEFGVKTAETKTGKEADYMLDEPDKKRYKLFQDVNIDNRKFLKGRMSTLHFRIHSLVTYWPNLEDLSVVVVYGKEKQKKKDLQAFNVEFEGVFSLSNSRDIPRYLNLEIVDEKDPANPQKVKYLSIDLKRLPFECPTKLNLKFREENPNIYNNNHITSEVELTLLLEGCETPRDTKVDYGLFFTVPELENPIYNTFRDKDFSQATTAGHSDEGEVERPTYHGGASFLKDRHAWKENFAVEYEEFLKIMKQIAPFWINVADLSKIYDAIAKANRNTTFYITDFFVLLILFGKFTSIQKFGLLFDLFTGFDDTFSDKTREIPYHVLKGLCAYIFDLFMIYMPYNELENIIDLTVYGDVSNIKKVTVNGQVTIKNDVIRQHLNRLSNFMHASYNTKELHLYQAPVLDILRSVYEKEISRTFEQPINKVEITYVTNGMSHKLRFDIDENWKIVEDQDGRKSVKAGTRVLSNYRNVIALQNTPKIYNRNEFIKLMQKLPMINYLCSLEHTEISSTLVGPKNVKFIINMEGKPIYTVSPTYEPVTKSVLANVDNPLLYKKKDFKTVLREWDDVVRVSSYKTGSSLRVQSGKPIPASKLNLFFSHNHLISHIKRSIIKSISEAIQKSSAQSDQFNPYLFNRNLWELDYSVTLSVNKNRDFDITDKKKSPFKTLIELMERTAGVERDIEDVEIVYNLKNTTIQETFTEPFSQLALYRYSEGSTEWLPCKIKYKFEYVRRDEPTYYNRETIDGFGVVFSRFPDETVLKRSSEVAIIKMIDFEELELKQVDPLTSKAITVDRGATGFSPQRVDRGPIQAQGGPKVLFQKPSNEDEDDNLFGSSKPQGSGYTGQKVRSGIPAYPLYDGVPKDEDYDEQFGGRLKVTY